MSKTRTLAVANNLGSTSPLSLVYRSFEHGTHAYTAFDFWAYACFSKLCIRQPKVATATFACHDSYACNCIHLSGILLPPPLHFPPSRATCCARGSRHATQHRAVTAPRSAEAFRFLAETGLGRISGHLYSDPGTPVPFSRPQATCRERPAHQRV